MVINSNRLVNDIDTEYGALAAFGDSFSLKNRVVKNHTNALGDISES